MPQPLGQEPWGAKLRRVRLAGGFTQRELAARITEAGEPISGPSLAMLEKIQTANTFRQKRVGAWACAICDIDVEALGLDIDELFRSPADLGKPDTTWYPVEAA